MRSGSILARHRVVVVVAPGNGPPMGPVFPADSGTGGGLCRGRTTRERPRGLNATAIEGGGQPSDPLHRSREPRYLLRDSRRLDCPVSGCPRSPAGPPWQPLGCRAWGERLVFSKAPRCDFAGSRSLTRIHPFASLFSSGRRRRCRHRGHRRGHVRPRGAGGYGGRAGG